MLGRNLRLLSKKYKSITDLCRQLDVNRTQFNRYLSGDSFPRPDVLHRICTFFGTDARILLEPLEHLEISAGVLNHPLVADYLGSGMTNISEDMFPSGFYRFSRQSFIERDTHVIGIVYVFRRDNHVFVRGYEARGAMRMHGLPTESTLREYRGVISPQEDGVSFLAAHEHNMATTYNYLSRLASFNNRFWIGFCARAVRETASGTRVTRLVYEHLGSDFGTILAAARSSGYCSKEELPPFHRKQLLTDIPTF